jgi:1,4-dihydroxy-2-naphthoyl-CoA synthase
MIILLLKVRPHVVMDLQWVASGGHFLKLVTHLQCSMKERPFGQSHPFQRSR